MECSFNHLVQWTANCHCVLVFKSSLYQDHRDLCCTELFDSSVMLLAFCLLGTCCVKLRQNWVINPSIKKTKMESIHFCYVTLACRRTIAHAGTYEKRPCQQVVALLFLWSSEKYIRKTAMVCFINTLIQGTLHRSQNFFFVRVLSTYRIPLNTVHCNILKNYTHLPQR